MPDNATLELKNMQLEQTLTRLRLALSKIRDSKPLSGGLQAKISQRIADDALSAIAPPTQYMPKKEA